MANHALKILLISLLISCLGIMSIYSSTYQKETKIWNIQIIWLCCGIVMFFIVSNFHYRKLWDWTYLLYAFVLFLLFLVFILGIIRLGAQRWLKFAWFNLQPSELAKLIVVIFLSRYFSTKADTEVFLKPPKMGITKALILPFFFISLPMFMIMEQPDLGSAMMIFFIFLAVLFLSGIKLSYIFTVFTVMLLLLPVAWHFLKDYQRDRLMVFVNPNIDPLGAGYTIIQSKIAIGSSGLFGKGWLSGTQSQLRFLPESHTDFIFATFVEEWGLIGSAILLLLYYLLLKEGLEIAQRTSDHFGRLLACGISLMLGIQIFVNISMSMGLAPVVGLPLPLMSYGGSSIVVTFISLGILASIDKRRAVF